MDPASAIDRRHDTSLAIMMECLHRGHEVIYVVAKDLRLTHDTLKAEAAWLRAADRTQGFQTSKTDTFILHEADVIFIRKDPPINTEYLYMAHQLTSLTGRVPMVNSPESLLRFNEKLFTFQFPKWQTPSLVTSQTNAILEFQKQIGDDLILKPLNLRGGERIKRLPQDSQEAETIIEEVTQQGKETVLAQRFLKGVETKGDKRLIVWNGKLVGSFRRMPPKGNYIANMSAGGQAVAADPTAEEEAMVKEMIPVFKPAGIRLAGLDLIDGFLTEINITSPAGFWEYEHLHGINLAILVLDDVEAGRI